MLDVLMSKWNGLTPTGKAGVIGGILFIGGAAYLLLSEDEEEAVEQIPAQNVEVIDDSETVETTAEVVESTEE